ncbi:hypothetical protein IAH97_01465 [Neoehrlichia mikurensis]|uniref:hypothetical protein n=1 Tax=Neoehrlichia mikurensis TaxID=89586 RepID=UPI001C4812FC|nr:hypothetical protein [Neoehrlichia mikurensis]QXK92216.1 hypothetical protein IAH97_01465 [Neoehrlichia mikurensis]
MQDINKIGVGNLYNDENTAMKLTMKSAVNNMINNEDVHSDCIPDHNSLEKQEFNYKYTVQNDLMTQVGLKVNFFLTIPMNESYKARADIEVKRAIEFFHEKFPLADSKSIKDINIFVFENSNQFHNKTDAYHVHLNDLVGGIAWNEGHHGNQAYTSYVFKSGSNILNLQHELAHILTWEATNKSYLNSILLEGISEYIQNAKDSNYIVDEDANGVMRFDTMEKIDSIIDILHTRHNFKTLDLEKVGDIIRSESSNASNSKDNATLYEYNTLKYNLGYVLVKFMQDYHPADLKEYFSNLKKYGYDNFDFKNYSEEFNQWMSNNTTNNFFKKYDILKVEKGDFIGVSNVSINGEVQSIKYFDANIKDAIGNFVGSLSPVQIYAIGNTLRIENANTHDMMNIYKEYHFMKLVQFDGRNKYMLCDEQGNSYINSLDYKNAIGKIISKYDDNFKKEFDLFKNAQNSSDSDKIKAANLTYIKALDQKVSDILHYRSDADINLRKVLINFTYIDGNQIRDINGVNIDQLVVNNPNEIFTVKSEGTGNISAVSVYMNDNKIGEMLTESAIFAQYNSTNNREIMQFQGYDVTRSACLSRFDQVALAVTVDQHGKKELNVLDNGKVNSGGVVLVEENKFFKPDICNIDNIGNLTVSKNVKIDNYEDRINYHDADKYIMTKGDIADTKGTNRTEDDTYFVQVVKDDEVLMKLKSIGFYISEEILDENGIVDKSALFINDYVTGKFFQLPGSITHLKLATINGERKLVPSTLDGNENPEGMPEDIGNYRYIDPIFAHKYTKEDESHEHINIGLINFDKYVDGALFKVQCDMEDYAIRRNDKGEIIRHVPYYKYYTKVKLLHDDQEIGMLSNRFDKYEGDLMISADLNYSYTDFLTSMHYQEVDLNKDSDGIVTLKFVGETDHEDKGYSNYSSARHKIDKNTDGYQHMEEKNAAIQENQRKANEEAHREKKIYDDQENIMMQKNTDVYVHDANTSNQKSTMQVNNRFATQDHKVNSESEYQKSFSFSVVPKDTTDNDGNITNTLVFFINDKITGTVYQLPDVITHVKLTTISDGQRKLVVCTSNGEENPDGMPDLGQNRYIDLTFVHSNEIAESAMLLNIDLADLNKYSDGVLFAIQSDDQYFATVKLIHDKDGKIGVLPFYLDRFQNIHIKTYQEDNVFDNKTININVAKQDNSYNASVNNNNFSYGFHNKDHDSMYENQLLNQNYKVLNNLYTQDSVYDGFMDVIHGLKGSNYAVDLI